MKRIKVTLVVLGCLACVLAVIGSALIVFVWNPLNQINYKDMRIRDAVLIAASDIGILAIAIVMSIGIVLAGRRFILPQRGRLNDRQDKISLQ